MATKPQHLQQQTPCLHPSSMDSSSTILPIPRPLRHHLVLLASSAAVSLSALLILLNLFTPFHSTFFSPSNYDPYFSRTSLLPSHTRCEPPLRLPTAEEEPPKSSSSSRSHEGSPAVSRTEFKAYGTGAALFVVYGAYRGGADTFAVVGLGAKSLYVYGDPKFDCVWEEEYEEEEEEEGKMEIQGKARVMLPDVGYGRVYTTVVVNCTFQKKVGGGNRGGRLVLYARPGRSNDPLLSHVEEAPPERILAFTETGPYDADRYRRGETVPYDYDVVYCGSPLYGALNARRVKEWIAYHAWLFGERSHFFFQDAGGVQESEEEVMAVLEPWIKAGRVTLLDVTAERHFDSYYHNQFLLVNDCLHRTRFLSNWTFFFDLDEFLYVAPELSIYDILSWHSNDTVLNFQQLRMSDSLCRPLSMAAGQNDDPQDDHHHQRWAFEKLVYGEKFTDTKYAVQARHVYATGVHYPQKELGHMEGKHGWAWWPKMHFYHYHNTISKHGKLCTNTTNNETYTVAGHNYTLDTTMVPLGPIVRQFEQEYIQRFI